MQLVEQGLVRDEEDLRSRRPDLLGELMLNWIQHTQTGCRFATHLAKQRDRAGWSTLVFPTHLDDETFATLVATSLRGAKDEAEMVMFVFPWADTPSDVAEVIRQLVRCEGWWWEEQMTLDEQPHDDVLVGLRWLLPSRTSESWALGFAPFDFMPFTRRGPYASVVLRPRDPTIEMPPEGRAPVHLAQVPHFLGDRGRYKGEVWLSTEQQRRDLLQGELTYAARARVTFALPKELVAQLPPPTTEP
jgi:hypothetical protein